jgi:hypothetical protein
VTSVTSDKGYAANCENITFTVTTDPAGHESLVTWSGGGEPASQEGGATFTTHWLCVGAKTVTATCGTSNRSKEVTVTLPNGCDYAGPHDSSVSWINPGDDYASWTCGVFGEFMRYMATYDVDFKYENCVWLCEISNVEAETRISVRDPASLLPDQVSVEEASDVPCVDANCAKVDLDDTDLDDDEGAPRCKYWCYSASIGHEEQHRADWQEFYGDALDDAIEYLENTCQSDIDCGDPNTISCHAAQNFWEITIVQWFLLAWNQARDKFDDPDTPLNEADQRAYEVNYLLEHPISAALPEGCTPH